MRKIIYSFSVLIFTFLFTTSVTAQESPTPTGPGFDWSIFYTEDSIGGGYANHQGWDNILRGSVFSAQDRQRLGGGRRGPNTKPVTGTRVPTGRGGRSGRSSGDENLIPYEYLTPDYNQALERYIVAMQSVKVTRLTRNEQFAYWLNLHNAAAFFVILNSERRGDADGYRLRVRNRPAIFDADDMVVEGVALSINDIAENILPLWQDPLAIYGLFFGARGGPNILPEAFTGRNVYDLLRGNALNFVGSDRAIMDIDDGTLELSELYRLYQPMFNNDDRELIRHLRAFSSPYRQRQLARVRDIEYEDMNWDLNDMSREARSNDWSEILSTRMGTFFSSGSVSQ